MLVPSVLRQGFQGKGNRSLTERFHQKTDHNNWLFLKVAQLSTSKYTNLICHVWFPWFAWYNFYLNT